MAKGGLWTCDFEHVEAARTAIVEGDLAGLKKLGLKILSGRSRKKCALCRRRTETSNHGASICFGCGHVFATDPWPANGTG